MTKEPQEEINRLMNEKLNADKMSLNPPLKFEPQEETYQALENKALEEIFMNRILFIGDEVPEFFTTDKRSKSIYLGTPQEMIDELKSHLQLAYQRGVDKTIERFATGEFIRGKEAEKFRQQAIAEERERIGKELKEWFNDVDIDKSYEVIEDAIERITGIKC